MFPSNVKLSNKNAELEITGLLAKKKKKKSLFRLPPPHIPFSWLTYTVGVSILKVSRK